MPRRFPLVLLVLAALLAGACSGGGGDPQEELTAAVEATFNDSFAFEFTVDADQSALAALGEGAQQAALFLSGFKVTGATEGDNTSLALRLVSIDVIEARSIGDEAVYVRLGLEEIAATFGQPLDPEALAGQLDAFGLAEDVRATVVTALQGGWVGIEGGLDATGLQELFGSADARSDEEVQDALEESFGADLPAFIDRFITVSERTDQNGQQAYRVDLQVRDLLRAAGDLSATVGQGDQVALEDLEADLAELPETVPGTVVVDDGLITRIQFDLGEAARAGGGDVEGRVDLTLDLDDHGEVAAIEAPEGADVLSAEAFTEALGQVMGFLTGFGT